MDKQIEKCQKEIDKKFFPKKKRSYKLVKAYQRLNEWTKAERCENCGSFLEWHNDDNINKCTLVKANFCKDKFCPLCAWRRSLKLYNQLNKIVDNLCASYRFLFVTLTVKNCTAEQLAETVKTLNSSFTKMMKTKRFKCIAGYFKILEITHDTSEFITYDMFHGNRKKHIKSKKRYFEKQNLHIGDKNPSFDTYHPHLHIMFAVDEDYFSSKDYITQKDLCDAWSKALNVDYTAVCDIRTVSDKNSRDKSTISFKSAICEVAKYSVKDTDYLNCSDELIDKTVRTLSDALYNVRLCSFAGVFKEVKQFLKLEDAFESDLLHVSNDEEMHESSEYTVIRYLWQNGKYTRTVFHRVCIDIFDGEGQDFIERGYL